VRDAVGARITATAGPRTQVRDVHMGSSYLSQDSTVQHFGLGAAARVDELTVEWPSGVVQRFTNLSVDRRMTVREWEGNRPTAVATDVSADAGDPVQFHGGASFDDTRVVSWRWDFTGLYAGLNLSGASTEHVFYFPDNFTGNLTVTDAFGNSNTTSFSVSIRPVNHPLVYAGPDLVLAEDATVDFTATLQGMLAPDAYDRTTFEWQIDGPVSSDALSGRNISYAFTDPGSYTVVVVATDQFGASGTDTVLVRVTDTLPPMIVFTPPLAVDEDTLVRFDASFTTDNDPAFASTSLFYWSLEGPMGQAEVQTGPTVQFVLRDPGIHRFAVSVNDSSGNQASLTFGVLARDVTPPVAEAGGDRVVRAGSSVTLDGSTSSDNDPAFMQQGSFVWSYDGPDGTGEIVGVTGKLFVTNPGVTTVRFHAVDPTGNADVVDDVFNITALDRTLPVVPPMADGSAAVGVPFPLQAVNATDNDPAFPRNASFQWTVADGTLRVTLSGQSANYTFTSLGRWPVTLSVVDAAGNAATQSFFVTVGDPVAPQALGVVPQKVIVGDPVALNATLSHDNVKISSYAWAINGPGTSVVLNGVYLVWRFTAPGNYSATLTVTDSSGNRNSTQFQVEVVVPEEPVVTPPPPPEENGTTPPPEGSWPPLIGVGAVGVAIALAVVALIVLRRRGRAQP
jgi:PKD repeat protein